MEIDVSLQDYLDQVKKQFNLDESLSYNKVLSILKNEVSFRENLILSMKEKTNDLMCLLKDDSYKQYLDELKISEIEYFKLDFVLGDTINEELIKKIMDLKLHYIFRMEFFTRFGKIRLLLTPNEKKLNAIKVFV